LIYGCKDIKNEKIQGNNFAKIEKIQGNNLPENEKIQGNNFFCLSAWGLKSRSLKRKCRKGTNHSCNTLITPYSFVNM
jgi:hypothetical protein